MAFNQYPSTLYGFVGEHLFLSFIAHYHNYPKNNKKQNGV
jgi:hypothetical protein